MSTRHLLLTLAGGLLCTAALHAEDTAPAKTEPAPEPYQLKHRSSFACAGEDVRAPFWPIGWVHRKGVAAVAQAAAPKAVLDERAFHVTSILLGTGPTASLAVINGRAYSEGEFLKMPRGTAGATVATVAAGTTATASAKPAAPAVARIRVQRINDGSVVLQREEQTVTVALQRPELVLKKIVDAQLDDEN